MIWNDEIVDEVRRVRDDNARKFDYDISAICADIRRQQSESERKVVSLPAKKIERENSDILKAA